MSAEEAVTEALQTPIDQNAQAAEEAEKMLAELQGDAASTDKPKEANGTSDTKEVEDSEPTETTAEARKDDSEGKERSSDETREHRDSGRSDHGGRGRGRDRGGRNDYGSRSYRDNIKSDVTTQEVSSDPVAIRKQVEFYFSDSNLPTDKFLFEKVGGTKNNPVELKIIHTFKRMRHFQPFEAIVEALRESKSLELTDDDTCVRRKKPLPDTKYHENEAMRRSVYVKGFGDEAPSTQFDIEAFFAPYGPTNAVRLRRNDEKSFKGSVFVEFETEDLAKAFLELDPKPKYKGKDLQIMSKSEYCDKKVEDINAGKIQPNNRYSKSGRQSRGDRDGGRKRDAEDTRDWRTRREEDRKHGFRDGKRGGNWDRNSRGGRGGRLKGTERDERGIPTVKASKHDSGREDALAKARAAVEAENQKMEEQNNADNESTEQNGDADITSKAANEDVEAIAGRKRAREDDEKDEGERKPKKVDLKADEVAPVNGTS